MPFLDNWSIGIRPCTDPYMAPELVPACLYGICDDHDKLRGSGPLTTSDLMYLDVTNKLALTKSGTVYTLGNPEPEWLEWISGKYALSDFNVSMLRFVYQDWFKWELIKCVDLDTESEARGLFDGTDAYVVAFSSPVDPSVEEPDKIEGLVVQKFKISSIYLSSPTELIIEPVTMVGPLLAASFGISAKGKLVSHVNQSIRLGEDRVLIMGFALSM